MLTARCPTATKLQALPSNAIHLLLAARTNQLHDFIAQWIYTEAITERGCDPTLGIGQNHLRIIRVHHTLGILVRHIIRRRDSHQDLVEVRDCSLSARGKE